MLKNVYVVEEELTSPAFGHAFAKGCGGIIRTTPEYFEGIWAGFGAPRIWDCLKTAIKSEFDFYYGDHAYFGRGKFYRVTKNAFQSRADKGKPDFKRLKPFWEKEKPWRKGSKIILCPQSRNHHERFGEPDWEENMVKKIRLYSDREIIIRTKKTPRPLLEDLKDAHIVVTHTSNSALEAILNGVPALCTGDCAASIMSISDVFNIERPLYPDYRLEWAARLASNQWTLDEIKTGKCWKALNDQV